MLDLGIRVEVDDRNEKIGYKIREAQTDKTPYMLIIGDKEIEGGTVSVRSRKKGELGAIAVDDFIKDVLDEINNKAI
jgi:threonyl-tRNA synthetase